MTTQKVIARKLRLSTATVSEVLRGYRNCTVSAKTKANIHKAAAELNYIPNQLAIGLRKGKTMQIGVMLPSPNILCNSLRLKGLVEGLDQHGYSVNVQFTDGRPEREKAAIQQFRNQRVAGAVLTRLPLPCDSDYEVEIKSLVKHDVCLVAMYKSPGWSGDLVQPGFCEAGQLAANHLIKLSHKNMVVLRDTPVVPSLYVTDLDIGFFSVLSKAGLEHGKQRIFAAPQTGEPVPNHSKLAMGVIKDSLYEQGYQAAGQALASGLSFTAVLCHGDEIAMGAMARFSDVGIKVPQDVAVIGLENEPFGAFQRPPLTTIDLEYERVGQAAAQLLVDRINSSNARSTPIERTIAPKLVIRKSCGEALEADSPPQVQGNRLPILKQES